MSGLYTVFRKELADEISSLRFMIMFGIVLVASILIVYNVSNYIRGSISADSHFIFMALFTTTGVKSLSFFNFVYVVTFFVPIIGIILGFDAINSEKNNGTMSRLVSQPIYRDAVINGKFLAGIVTIAIMLISLVLLVSGLGLRMIGVPPTSEEAVRLLFFLITAIIYGAFWLGLSILFSTLFRHVAVSALASIALWLFFFIFIGLIAMMISQQIAPAGDTLASQIRNSEVQQMILRISPITLFQEAVLNLLVPEANIMEQVYSMPSSTQFIVPNPLSMGQSLLIIWPHLVTIIVLTVICFAVSYVKFMREEIRAL